MKHAFFIALTLVLTGLGLAAVGETLLRLHYERRWQGYVRDLPPLRERCFVPSADPALRWELNPGFDNGSFTVNSWGMADRELAREKAPGTRRVAFVGDSVSANFGLTPRPQIYVNRVERLLDERVEPHDDVEVLNFGVNGYGIEQTARVVTTRVDRFEPDVVVLQLCLNDPYPSEMAGMFRDEIPGSRLRAFLGRRFDPDHFWADWLVARRFDGRGRRQFEDGLRTIGDHARARSVPVLVVLFPYMYRPAYDEWGFAAYHAFIGELVERNGLAWLDLEPAFEEAGLLDRGGDPIHPDVEGHEVAAREIARRLEREAWLP